MKRSFYLFTAYLWDVLLHSHREDRHSPISILASPHCVLTFICILREYKPGMVAHTCNTSYCGGRDQEDQGSRPDWAKSQ
jgi:hypothetical protein